MRRADGGAGQFVPGEGAAPVIGSVGTLETVDEHRVEVQIRDASANRAEVKRAIEELKKVRLSPVSLMSGCRWSGQVHPYEEVAVDVYRLEEI